MAVYTCFDMMADCPAGRPEGWRYFIVHFLPACRDLLQLNDEELGEILVTLRDDPSSPLRTLSPMPEREFAVHLHDFLVRRPDEGGEEPVPLEAELESLTATEKQILWFDLRGYDTAVIADLFRVFPETVSQVRGKAGAVDFDSLRRAAQPAPQSPVPIKTLLDAIDGRLTWAERQDLEKKVASSWHEVDRFCRVRKVDAALRNAKPLTEAETVRFLQTLGMEPPKPSFWRRFASGQ